VSNGDEVIHCARVMRRYLSRSDMLGNDAPSTDCRMEALLTRAEAGEDVAGALRALIDQHVATREWAKHYLQPAPVLRGYKVAPGMSGPVAARSRYVCPKCGRSWILQQVGEEVPDCPIDLIPRVDTVDTV
jgi:hypothetical protein